MTNLFNIRILIICFMFYFFPSCEGPETEIPIMTGDLFGRVETFDEFGQSMPDHKGVEVIIEGTDPLLKTLTDASGNYSFEGLQTGTYNLVFTKDRFQTRKVFSYQFVGGKVPTYFNTLVYLSEKSTTSITEFSISVTDENNPDSSRYTTVKVEHATSPPSTQDKPRPLNVYLSTSDGVSIDNYEYKLSLGITGNIDIIRIDRLPSNSTCYAIMYPIPAFCNPYYDPFSDLYDYSCYGTPSEVISFQVP